MFSLLLEFSDSVSAFIIGFDFLSHPVVCLVVVNPDPSPQPRRLLFTHPSPLPRPPTSSGHSSAVVHRVSPLSRVCALSSCLIKWWFFPHSSKFELVYHYAVTGEGNGNPLQYSCLEKSHGRRNLVGCSPWGRTESDTTEAT